MSDPIECRHGYAAEECDICEALRQVSELTPEKRLENITGHYEALLEECDTLKGIAKRMAPRCIEQWFDGDAVTLCRCCRLWNWTELFSHADDCPVRQLAEMTGGTT